MTQLGTPVEGPVDGPDAGAVLSGRYRLDSLVFGERNGARAVWRGTDLILARTVAIEIRIPGGPAATDMLQAAYAAGRVIHPCLVSVYDAVDDGTAAYVVSEWAAGRTLRDQVREAPLPPARAAAVAKCVAEGLAALHAAGVTHGNVHPGSVWVQDVHGECTVRLSSVRPAVTSSITADIRAIGGVLYAALTGQWPVELPTGQFSTCGLPDAHRQYGRPVSPRQIRAGIPPNLDGLVSHLLGPEAPTLTAAEVAGELTHLPEETEEPTSLLAQPEVVVVPAARRRNFRLVGVLALVVVLLFAGWVVLMARSGDVGGQPPQSASTSPVASPTPLAGLTVAATINANEERSDFDRAVDGDSDTHWDTDSYKQANFGNLKPGIGIVIDTGDQQAGQPVSSVTIETRNPSGGAVIELRYADEVSQADMSSSPDAFTSAGPAQTTTADAVTFALDQPQAHRYWLVWITKLPSDSTSRTTAYGFSLDISEIRLVTG